MNARACTLTVVSSLFAAACGSVTPSSIANDAGPHVTTGKDATARKDVTPTDAAGSHFTQERIIFLVEVSGAEIVIDPSKARTSAIHQVVQNHVGDASVQYSVIALSTSSQALPSSGFAPTLDEPTTDQVLDAANDGCDYEEGFDAVTKLIDQDATGATLARRAQTRYVVIFIAGGDPTPQCTGEATACGSGTCDAGRVCSAGTCSIEVGVCTVPRSEWATTFSPPINTALYPDLMTGADFNTPALIQTKVTSLVALKSKDGIGAIEVNTVLDFDPAALTNPLATPFGLDRTTAAALLGQLAKTGGGRYIDLSTTPQLPF